jgi:hypothetical protein
MNRAKAAFNCGLYMLAMLLPIAAFGTPEAFGGTWAVLAQGHTILVLQIDLQQSPLRAAGSMARPADFQLSQRLTFSKVRGPAKVMPLRDVRFEGKRLLFSAASPSDPKALNRFELEVESPDLAHLKVIEAPLPPLVLIRVDKSTKVPDRWNPDVTYAMEDHARSNDELRRLYDEDQKARADVSKIDWEQLAAADTQRRTRVRSMMANGDLKTGRDFERAAFIFQHGTTSDDYLLAHTLATIAAAKGNADALWIGSAALDRYLQSIGQPQIFGTQFQQEGAGPWTQAPFNSSIISDALRQQLGVPSLAEQEVQRREYESKTSGSKQ